MREMTRTHSAISPGRLTDTAYVPTSRQRRTRLCRVCKKAMYRQDSIKAGAHPWCQPPKRKRAARTETRRVEQVDLPVGANPVMVMGRARRRDTEGKVTA